MNENLIIAVWDMFREYIPEKNREMAANQFVDYLLGKDMSVDDLGSFLGYDPHLDEAIKSIQEEEGGYEDDENWDYNEDEDY